MTCNIGDVTQAVDVSWKDSAGGPIAAETEGYSIVKGSVDPSTKIQKSTLTIEADTLKALTTTSPLTWKCAAKSEAHANSAISAFEDVVVTFLTFGMFVESVDLK